ncbi:MAG TPA: sodium ion-translocating decarboxylase subunit beta [Planctomycetaceae bacterium]|nr:sodium ion-translocating decarboxylase subunit beta [Planctomycetaceae bacterium]
MDVLFEFLKTTGFTSITFGNAIMILIGIAFITLAIRKDYEPLLLVPIGMGAIVGNIPVIEGMSLSVYDAHSWVISDGEVTYVPGSVLSYLYFGVSQGIYPPLIFLGIGAMTDFSTMLSNPKLILLGAAAQIGVFLTFLGALLLNFTYAESGAIGIIGGADGPTAIFLASKLAPHLLGAIAIAAYSYMALVPVIQPPIMRLLTTREERLIRMKPPRKVSKREKMIFPVAAFLITTMIAPGAIVLLGMLFFGNLLKESLVTERLANTARTAMIDIVTILLGFSVGASTQAQTFLRPQSLGIFALGAASFAVATAGGLLFAKFMNLFLTEKINPLIGAAGVSAVPDSARVVQMVGQQEDPHNFLLMHAMAPNVAGVIGSAIAAGVLWAVLV